MIEKIRVKGVDYDLGGSGGGSGVKSMRIPLEFEFFYPNEFFNTEYIEAELDLGINQFDFSRPISIDFRDENDISLHVATYNPVKHEWNDIGLINMFDLDINILFNGMTLFSSGDLKFYYDWIDMESVIWFQLLIEEASPSIFDFLLKTKEVIVYGYELTPASPTNLEEI